MRRPRVTIARLMGIVLTSSFAFAALRRLDETWAILAFSAALMSVILGALVGLAKPARARSIWWAYSASTAVALTFAFSPRGWINPRGLRPPPFITAILVGQVEARTNLVGNNQAWIISTDPEGAGGRILADPGDLAVGFGNSSRPPIALRISPSEQILHSLAAILCGLAGAIVVAFATRNDCRPAP